MRRCGTLLLESSVPLVGPHGLSRIGEPLGSHWGSGKDTRLAFCNRLGWQGAGTVGELLYQAHSPLHTKWEVTPPQAEEWGWALPGALE